MPVPARWRRRYDRQRRAAERTSAKITARLRADENGRGHRSRLADLRERLSRAPR